MAATSTSRSGREATRSITRPLIRFNNAPFFHVSFDPIHQTNSIQLSDINTVFERNRWYPRIGTEGRPYAIATDVSGLYLTPI